MRGWLRRCYVEDESRDRAGFVASPSATPDPQSALTYACLAALTMCGDDLSMVNRRRVGRTLRSLQRSDGAVCASALSPEEADVRFVYAALAAEQLLRLQPDQGIDRRRAIEYVCACQCYDGSFALRPGLEGHGGSTYCALASLAICGQLSDPSPLTTSLLSSLGGFPPPIEPSVTEAVPYPRWSRRSVERWLMRRQLPSGAPEGRPGRGGDVCYAWWVGASRAILGLEPLSLTPLRAFLSDSQDGESGGFAKCPDVGSDPLHSAYALAGLALAAVASPTSLDDGDAPETTAERPLAALDPVHGIPAALMGVILARRGNDDDDGDTAGSGRAE